MVLFFAADSPVFLRNDAIQANQKTGKMLLSRCKIEKVD
jgi:hypothetical protein